MPLEQTKEQFDFYTSLHGLVYRKAPIDQISQRIDTLSHKWARTIEAASKEWRRQMTLKDKQGDVPACETEHLEDLAITTFRGLSSLTSNAALSSIAGNGGGADTDRDHTHEIADAIVSAVGCMYTWGSLPVGTLMTFCQTLNGTQGNGTAMMDATSTAALLFFWFLWQNALKSALAYAAIASSCVVSSSDSFATRALVLCPPRIESQLSAFIARYIVLNSCDSSGYTMLHYAARGGYEEAVGLATASLFFDSKSKDPATVACTNLYAATPSGQTCLHRAVSQGHTTVASQLVTALSQVIGALQIETDVQRSLSDALMRVLVEGADSAGRSAKSLVSEECPEVVRPAMKAVLRML